MFGLYLDASLTVDRFSKHHNKYTIRWHSRAQLFSRSIKNRTIFLLIFFEKVMHDQFSFCNNVIADDIAGGQGVLFDLPPNSKLG
jgi:hypothetical protein